MITICREARLLVSGMMGLLNNSTVHPMQIAYDIIYFIPNGTFFSYYKDEIPINKRSLRSHLSWASFPKLVTSHANLVYGITFSPNNTRIATSSRDNFIKIWDAATGDHISTLEGHTNWIYAIAYSNDGSLIVTGARDETVRVWDGTSGVTLHAFTGQPEWTYSVCFSPDGLRIASGGDDNIVRVMDIKSSTQIHTLIGHTNDVWSITFSNDGTRLVSGSEDETARVWDMETGAYLFNLVSHSQIVYSIVFSSDGKTMATASSGDNVLKLWDASSGAYIRDLDDDTSDWMADFAFKPKPNELGIASEADKRMIRLLGEDEDNSSDEDSGDDYQVEGDRLSAKVGSTIASGDTWEDTDGEDVDEEEEAKS